MSNSDAYGQSSSRQQGNESTGGFGHQAGASSRDQVSAAGSGSNAGQRPGQPMKEQARDIANQARERGRQMASQASEHAKEAGRQLSEQAANAAEHARRYGNEVLSDQKNRAASQLDSFGQAIHAAGDRLHDDNDHAIADYVHALGEQVERASGYIRDRDMSALASDLRSFARRRPEWFLGGAFIAGLALARFAKARDPGYESSYGGDYGRSYGDDYEGGYEAGGQAGTSAMGQGSSAMGQGSACDIQQNDPFPSDLPGTMPGDLPGSTQSNTPGV